MMNLGCYDDIPNSSNIVINDTTTYDDAPKIWMTTQNEIMLTLHNFFRICWPGSECKKHQINAT